MVLLKSFSALAVLSAAAVNAAPSKRDYVNYHPQVVTSYDGSVDITYQGFLNTTTNVEQFLAIPYAQPPLAQLRFSHPVAWTPTNATSGGLNLLDATQHGKNCKQPGRNASSEDCLILNIARHTSVQYGEKLPVLVWIHGGDYISGAGDDEEYNPAKLVTDSVDLGEPMIVISINYRLSAYGGLLGEQAKKANATNLGQLDQRLALEWINEHIYNFGGDKDRVTIMGASAGGGSIVGQMLLEGMEPKGLFAQVMHMSGAFIWNWERSGLLYLQEDLYVATQCVGLSDPVACMREIPEDELFEAVSSIGSNSFGDNFGPTYGDVVFPQRPLDLIKAGYLAQVPIITGDVADELAALTPAATNTSLQAATFLSSMVLSLSGQDSSILWPYYSNLTTDLSPHPFNATIDAAYSPWYKRLTTAISEILFLSARQALIDTQLTRSLPLWSYTFNQPLSAASAKLGSTHYSDIPLWFGSTTYTNSSFNALGLSMRKALISYVAKGDPAAISGVAWDSYAKEGALIEWTANATAMIINDAHTEQLDAILAFVA